MRKRGHITVFLSMVLICVFSLLCGLIESARTAGARYYLRLAADSATDSLFSRYHKDAWESYRLFLLEYENEGEAETVWQEFLTPYMEYSGWYALDAERAKILQLLSITDQDGEHLKQEIADYMKYGFFEDFPDESQGLALLENLKEASAVKDMAQAFNSRTREAVRLEQAIQDINDSLKSQKKSWQNANNKLETRDGSGFRKEASKLLQEMNRIPGLVKVYEKRAEELKQALERTYDTMVISKEEISPEVFQTLKEDTSCYAAYVEQDGERRKEITAIPERIEPLKQALKQAVECSLEVEEIISEWKESGEGDEDGSGDGPDLDALWSSVTEIWKAATPPEALYSSGVKDSEKQKLLEKLEDLIQTGLLALVLPEGSRISSGVLAGGEFPSALYEEGRGQAPGIVDRILFGAYSGHFLTSFVSEEEKEVTYELEYLLSGKDTDEENLKQAVGQLLLLREGLNLLHILSDSEKREEAKALAAVITGALGAAPLAGVVAFFIMSVWALGESVVDIRMLLKGKKTVLIKSKDTWNLSLSALLEMEGEKGNVQGGEKENGIDYTGYLKLLLFMEQTAKHYYRLMDVIQMNLCRKQVDFRMENCAYYLEIAGMVRSKHLFFGGFSPFYEMEVRTEKAY